MEGAKGGGGGRGGEEPQERTGKGGALLDPVPPPRKGSVFPSPHPVLPRPCVPPAGSVPSVPPPEHSVPAGIGLDSCVIPLRHGGLSLVQTTDFFYPIIDDPYMMVLPRVSEPLWDPTNTSCAPKNTPGDLPDPVRTLGKP